MAQTETRSIATAETLRVLVDEFFRIQREPVNGRELEDAKACLTGSFPLGIETPDGIATKILTALFYGLPLAELQKLRERVEAVTLEDVERVTRAYLRPDRLSIALVGDASAIIGPLQRVGFKAPEIIPAPDLDLTEPGFRRVPAPAAAGPLAVSSSSALRGDREGARAIVMKAAGDKLSGGVLPEARGAGGRKPHVVELWGDILQPGR
jgi:hypothetical protein